MGKIKGWKKVVNRKREIEWHGDDGDAVKIYYVPDYQGFGRHWLVGASGMLHVKKFKSKSEAIKAATIYMKMRPRG